MSSPGPQPHLAAGTFAQPGLRGSLVRKLTALVAITLAIVIVVLLVGSYFYWRKVVRKIVETHLTMLAKDRGEMVHAHIAQLLLRVELNTDRGEMRGLLYELSQNIPSTENRTGSQASLQLIANGYPIVAASIANAKGVIVLSTDPAEVGRNVAAKAEFPAGLSRPYLGRPQWRNDRFEAILAAPIRTRSDPHNVYGVLFATANVSAMADQLGDTTGLGQTGEVIAASRYGEQLRFLFPPRNSPQTTLVPLEKAPELEAATRGETAFRRVQDYRGITTLAAARPLDYSDWALVVKMDEKEAYAPIARVVGLGVLFGLVVAAIGMIVAYLLARRFVHPVQQLAAAAARVAGGDYSAPVPVNSADELGVLSSSFNSMTTAIQTRSAERDRAEEALRDADQRKDEFLAMLGHELRNPLSGIANAARLWKEAPDEPEVVKMAQNVIERQTATLSRHVEDLLDVARISEGKIELRKQPIEMGETIHRAVEGVRMFIEEKQQKLEVTLAAGGPRRVDADPTRVEQIITNLLANASKYTPAGGRISIAENYEADDVVITVRDNGQGIPPDMLPDVFELFTQGDHSMARSSGGLGIGLNLCRQLVDLHGGSITAHSEGAGRGAEFSVRLPITESAAAAPPAQSSPGPTALAEIRRRILVVDDNKDTVRLLSRLLIRRGHEVGTAYDGLSALEVARKFQPDFLLLDIGLPGLDGYSLARRLRATGFRDTPMIAISGYAQESDRALAREAGFDHHFGKPVDFDALSALLASTTARTAPQS